MKKILTISLGILVVLFILLSYLNSNAYIKSNEWKYSYGYSVGDWLILDENSIVNDTLKGNGVNCEIVFCYGKTLIIRDFVSGEEGYYTSKAW